MIFDVTLLTESRYENPQKPDWYVQNILKEDGLVKSALEKRGLRVARVDWASDSFDWSQTKSAVFRTTWDYFHRFNEFFDWLESTKEKTTFINSADQIKWNIDKHYLIDLEKKGITIPPSVFIEPGTTTNLRVEMERRKWADVILKPAISGAARHTYKINANNIDEHEPVFQELIAKETMMIQPFQHQVVSRGELAFMIFGGQFSHAILKKAKKGDFRVQDDFGGSVHPYFPTKQEIDFAEHAVGVLDPVPVYARVDVIWNNNNDLAVSELELIEPELWFRYQEKAADLLAEEIIKRL